MIDAEDIILRKKGEQGSNVSKNPLPEHESTVGAIMTDEDFVDPTQYIMDKIEVFGIMEVENMQMRKLLSVEESMTKIQMIFLRKSRNVLCLKKR